MAKSRLSTLLSLSLSFLPPPMITAPDVTMGEREEETARGRLLLVRPSVELIIGRAASPPEAAGGEPRGNPVSSCVLSSQSKHHLPLVYLDVICRVGITLLFGWLRRLLCCPSQPPSPFRSFVDVSLEKEQDLIEKVTVRQQVRRTAATLTHKYDMSPADDVGTRSSRPTLPPSICSARLMTRMQFAYETLSDLT